MYYIGVDIGGTGIQAGIVSESGKILLVKECKTDVQGGFEKVLQDIKALINELLIGYGITMKEIVSIGFGVPSSINLKGEVTCVNLGWKQVAFLPSLRSLYSEVQVYAENDATVAAVAEAKFGTMKERAVAVMLTLGTGVGSGIIINGKPFVGAQGMGSELGHMIIGENDFECNCGNNGCFETFCSATAIIKYTQKLLEEGAKSQIREKCQDHLNRINAKMVFDAYRAGDEVAIQVITRLKHYLAIGIANIINSIDPHVIALGGGVSRAGDILLEGLKEEVRKYVVYKDECFADLVIAGLGNEAGIIGAAFLGQ